MKDISYELIKIMESSGCDSVTALIYLGGDENVSNTLRISESLPKSDVLNYTTDNQGTRETGSRDI